MVTVFSTHVIVGSFFNDIRIKKKFSTKAGIPDFLSIKSWDLRYLNNALATIVSKVITAPKMDIHAASAAAGEFNNSALNILELIGLITLIHPPVSFLSFSLFVPSTTQFARHNKTASGCHYSAMNVPFAKKSYAFSPTWSTPGFWPKRTGTTGYVVWKKGDFDTK